MRKIITYLLVIPLILSGCYKEDVSVLYSRQHKLEKELAELQKELGDINSEISVIYNIINNSDEDKIIRVDELADKSGWEIEFSKSGVKTIRHGRDVYLQ